MASPQLRLYPALGRLVAELQTQLIVNPVRYLIDRQRVKRLRVLRQRASPLLAVLGIAKAILDRLDQLVGEIAEGNDLGGFGLRLSLELQHVLAMLEEIKLINQHLPRRPGSPARLCQ